jgi:hypothetical protein
MLRQHRGLLLVNPGSLGQPFREFVAGRAPTLMPHAEYAVIEGANGRVGVDLRRVELDKADLRAEAAAAPENPLTPFLLEQYS